MLREHLIYCPSCGVQGYINQEWDDKDVNCDRCGGRGKIYDYWDDLEDPEDPIIG